MLHHASSLHCCHCLEHPFHFQTQLRDLEIIQQLFQRNPLSPPPSSNFHKSQAIPPVSDPARKAFASSSDIPNIHPCLPSHTALFNFAHIVRALKFRPIVFRDMFILRVLHQRLLYLASKKPPHKSSDLGEMVKSCATLENSMVRAISKIGSRDSEAQQPAHAIMSLRYATYVLE